MARMSDDLGEATGLGRLYIPGVLCPAVMVHRKVQRLVSGILRVGVMVPLEGP